MSTKVVPWILVVVVIAIASVLAFTRRPPPTPPVSARGYGSVMTDVAHRFELLGRASTAGRFELADYELGELEEELESLESASPPKEGHPEVLPGLLANFQKTTVAELRGALTSRDRARFLAAFEHAAGACNACHQASGHGFIEVPTTPGQPIPMTSPAP